MGVNDIIKLTIQMLIPVIATAIFCLLDRFTAFHKLPNFISFKKSSKKDIALYFVKQLIIGVVFGLIAISCNLTNIWKFDYQGAIPNARDASPLAAGLLFGAPAGIIAGLMGGIQRWTLGGFTQVACSVSTIIAGFYAAALRKILFKNHRPNWSVAFFAGIVMEVFHLFMVFLTHFDEAQKAASIIYALTIPIVAMTSISIFISRIVAGIINKEILALKLRERHISAVIQKSLIILVVGSFLTTSVVLYFVQTGLSENDVENQLKQTAADFESTVDESMDIAGANEFARETYYHNIAQYHNVNEKSGVAIANARQGIIVSGLLEAKNLKELLEADSSDFEIPTKMFIAEAAGEKYYTYIYQSHDFYIISHRLVSDAMYSRNISIYLNSFLEILVFAVLFAQVYIVIKYNISNNLDVVNEKLDEISAGKLDTVVNVNANYEFKQLSTNINSTVSALKGYIDAEAARFEKDLIMAHSIQLSALPNIFPAFPGRKEFDIYASMTPAKEVGGDFYDFYLTTENVLNFLVADVSGKGIPAAMFMMRAKTILKSLASQGITMGEIFTESNNSLCEGNDSMMFVTSWMGQLDLRNGKVVFANAGHNPPIIRHKDGKCEYLRAKVGLVLAGMEGIPYKSQEFQLEEGDTIFLYTDGVTEATDAHNQLYGEDRLINFIENCHYSSVQDLCKQIKADVDAFVGEAPQFDDITMLSVEYKGLKRKKFEFENACLNDIEIITEGCDPFFEEMEAPMKAQIQIKVAIDELYSNIVKYGYNNTNQGYASVLFEEDKSKNGVIITFEDEGVPYNPLKKEDPNIHLSAEERQIGGLGIFVVKKTMDDMTYAYQGGRNILKLYKSF